MREQYEAMAIKDKQELEKWFRATMEALQTEISSCSKEVKTYSSELKKTYQSLEISPQNIITDQNLEEVKSLYSVQLSQLQASINMLETELQRLRVSLEQLHDGDNRLLLDIKMRLELEISEDRRLLERESCMRESNMKKKK
ncbi:keratin%2C type I cytoskeletal 13-like [Xyrichtys novacula]|uniref:Keratin, type I cytoskeletal 13-like n=1 Tax=Xyrichtys novacula TaxID=13765 RepID=A0AAV1EUZ9_XYRNO|nr:keratin%2C type I cytoskeletal 13-like [Xyrichtys novacula]